MYFINFLANYVCKSETQIQIESDSFIDLILTQFKIES